MPIIELDALDTLFFRDGKPFSMGDDVWADGIFPPSPSVFYGAIRSIYFSENIDKLELTATINNDPTKDLIIKGIFFSINEKPYFPLPMDLVKEKNSEKNKTLLLKKTESKIMKSSNLKFSSILNPGEYKVENIENGLLISNDFKDYLKGENPPYFSLDDYISREPKIGIAREYYSKTSEEGRLYRVNMIRTEAKDKLKDKIKFLIEYDGLKIKSNGFLKLGGEGKVVQYETKEISFIPALDNTDFAYFKLYLLTPAIFENGTLPSWVNLDTLEGEYKGISLKLETAIIGKYLSIGGFDMAKKEPKIMRRAVPAGSVYYFKILNGSSKEVINNFHYKSISEFDSSKEGFGVVMVGKAE